MPLFDFDDAVRADLADRLSDELADLFVVVGRDGGDLLVVSLALAAGGHVVDLVGGNLSRCVDPALQLHRVGARCDVAKTFSENRRSEDRRARRAVAGFVIGFLGDLVDHPGAHVGERLGKLDLLGDGDAVLGDGRPAKGFLDHDVATGGAHRRADSPSKLLDSRLELDEGAVFKHQLFRGHGVGSRFCVSSRQRRQEHEWPAPISI